MKNKFRALKKIIFLISQIKTQLQEQKTKNHTRISSEYSNKIKEIFNFLIFYLKFPTWLVLEKEKQALQKHR